MWRHLKWLPCLRPSLPSLCQVPSIAKPLPSLCATATCNLHVCIPLLPPPSLCQQGRAARPGGLRPGLAVLDLPGGRGGRRGAGPERARAAQLLLVQCLVVGGLSGALACSLASFTVRAGVSLALVCIFLVVQPRGCSLRNFCFCNASCGGRRTGCCRSCWGGGCIWVCREGGRAERAGC